MKVDHITGKLIPPKLHSNTAFLITLRFWWRGVIIITNLYFYIFRLCSLQNGNCKQIFRARIGCITLIWKDDFIYHCTFPDCMASSVNFWSSSGVILVAYRSAFTMASDIDASCSSHLQSRGRKKQRKRNDTVVTAFNDTQFEINGRVSSSMCIWKEWAC